MKRISFPQLQLLTKRGCFQAQRGAELLLHGGESESDPDGWWKAKILMCSYWQNQEFLSYNNDSNGGILLHLNYVYSWWLKTAFALDKQYPFSHKRHLNVLCIITYSLLCMCYV